MKNYILALITLGFFVQVNAQTLTEIIPYSNDSRVITTGVPFLLIAADARAAGMGDMGVATSVDVYSQQWNPSKYAFATAKSGIGISYTPYLSKLVNDISIGQVFFTGQIFLACMVDSSRDPSHPLLVRYFLLVKDSIREKSPSDWRRDYRACHPK